MESAPTLKELQQGLVEQAKKKANAQQYPCGKGFVAQRIADLKRSEPPCTAAELVTRAMQEALRQAASKKAQLAALNGE